MGKPEGKSEDFEKIYPKEKTYGPSKKKKQNPNRLKLKSPSGGVGAGMRRFNRGGKV